MFVVDVSLLVTALCSLSGDRRRDKTVRVNFTIAPLLISRVSLCLCCGLITLACLYFQVSILFSFGLCALIAHGFSSLCSSCKPYCQFSFFALQPNLTVHVCMLFVLECNKKTLIFNHSVTECTTERESCMAMLVSKSLSVV